MYKKETRRLVTAACNYHRFIHIIFFPFPFFLPFFSFPLLLFNKTERDSKEPLQRQMMSVVHIGFSGPGPCDCGYIRNHVRGSRWFQTNYGCRQPTVDKAANEKPRTACRATGFYREEYGGPVVSLLLFTCLRIETTPANGGGVQWCDRDKKAGLVYRVTRFHRAVNTCMNSPSRRFSCLLEITATRTTLSHYVCHTNGVIYSLERIVHSRPMHRRLQLQIRRNKIKTPGHVGI